VANAMYLRGMTVQNQAYRKRSRAAQKLSAGRMWSACQCLDHTVLVYIMLES